MKMINLIVGKLLIQTKLQMIKKLKFFKLNEKKNAIQIRIQ